MNQFSSEKILQHLESVLEWQKTGMSRPVTYELDMTNICNSKCPFCFGFLSRETDTASLKLDEVKDLIKQIKEYGGKGLTFTGGGEPLMNSFTIDAVKYARELGLDIGFISNGLLLNEEKAEVLVDSCTWIRISIDAGRQETYKLTHGLEGTSFENAINNTKLLVEKKRNKGSKVTLGTGFLTFPDVSADMTAFVQISKDIGVDYAQFRPLLRKFGQNEINAGPDKEIIESIEKCKMMETKSFKVLCSTHKYNSMSNGIVKRHYDVCHGHHFTTVIAANRKMYLCCHMRGFEKYCIGDLSKYTLKELWESERRKKVYNNIDFKDCPLLCRCDGLNTVLWKMCQENEHKNFL